MSKLMDIIDRRLDERLNKMGELKLVPAQVTAVRADFLRADVKLLANGAEIKDMLNKTAEKLTVGQTVTIGYQTLPSSGVIMFANGEADLIRQGGGVEVETAALLDENNAHHWLADQELILDIDATTHLLYGGHQRFVTVQGYVCRFGTGTTLTDTDKDMFNSELTFSVLWREDASSEYVAQNVNCKLFVNSLSAGFSGGVQTGTRYAFALVLRGDGWEQTYTSTNILVSNESSIYPFIVPTVTTMSFADSFSSTWSGTTETVSTPYGHVVGNNLRLYFGYVIGSTVTVAQWRNNSGAVDVFVCGRNNNQTHKCVALESDAEGCFDVGLVQRSTPVTPST